MGLVAPLDATRGRRHPSQPGSKEIEKTDERSQGQHQVVDSDAVGPADIAQKRGTAVDRHSRDANIDPGLGANRHAALADRLPGISTCPEGGGGNKKEGQTFECLWKNRKYLWTFCESHTTTGC